MDWKLAIMASLRWKMLLLGAAAGAGGAFLHEGGTYLAGPGQALAAGGPLAGAGLGLAVGALLSPLDDLLGGSPHRTALGAVLGAVCGAAAGAAAPALALLTLGHPQWGAWIAALGIATLGSSATAQIVAFIPWAVWSLMLGLISASVGACSAWALRRGGRARARAVKGLFGGALIGLGVIGLLDTLALGRWWLLGGLAAWGALLSLTLFWGERRYARFWLRQLNGRGEDNVHPLTEPRVTLGSHQHNDILLTDFLEVYPFHCTLRRGSKHFELPDEEQGGAVLVNFRQAQNQTLKSGDLLKIGTALFQYGEAS